MHSCALLWTIKKKELTNQNCRLIPVAPSLSATCGISLTGRNNRGCTITHVLASKNTGQIFHSHRFCDSPPKKQTENWPSVRNLSLMIIWSYLWQFKNCTQKQWKEEFTPLLSKLLLFVCLFFVCGFLFVCFCKISINIVCGKDF